jgi:hypothetical protein
MHCDAILAVAAAGVAETTPITERIKPIGGSAERDASDSEVEVDGPESRHARLEREFSDFASAPDASQNQAVEKGATTDSAEGNGTKSDVQEAVSPSNQNNNEDSRDATRSSAMPQLRDRTWRSNWSLPIFRILPAMPIHVQPAEENVTKAAEVDSQLASPAPRPTATKLEPTGIAALLWKVLGGQRRGWRNSISQGIRKIGCDWSTKCSRRPVSMLGLGYRCWRTTRMRMCGCWP